MWTGLNRALAALAGLAAAAVLGLLLHGALAAFSWKNFLMSDYGVYTNTVWNLGHGNGFTFLADHDYLRTHLSYSLALLGPLFRVWDSPLLLLVVQWLFLAGGAATLWRLGVALRVPGCVTAGVLLLLAGYPFTQNVMLSEFHGVSAYLLLVPWLVYALERRKELAAIPLLLILGLREDAGLLLPAVLCYYAVRDRWRAGYVYAALSLVYVLAAVLWLYPLLHGEDLFEMRMGQERGFAIRESFNRAGLLLRLRAAGWLLAALAPLLLLARQGWKPMLVFPAAALLVAMGSGMPRQHGLQFHYPAAVMAFAAAGMIAGAGRARLAAGSWRGALSALLMAAVTVAAHRVDGLLPSGGREQRVYASIQVDGVQTLKAARQIPKSGLLLCSSRLAPFCANRAQLVTWRYRVPERHDAELVFCSVRELGHRNARDWVQAMRRGEAGARVVAFPYVVLSRGEAGALTREVLRMVEDRTHAVARMARGAGANRILPGEGLVRYWEGDGTKAPVILAHGVRVGLPPGRFAARFRYRAAAPEAGGGTAPGRFEVHAGRRSLQPLAEVAIPVPEGNDGGFRTADVTFSVPPQGYVEPRVIGGDTELWVHSVAFVPLKEIPPDDV